MATHRTVRLPNGELKTLPSGAAQAMIDNGRALPLDAPRPRHLDDPRPAADPDAGARAPDEPLLSPEDFDALGWNKARSYIKERGIELEYEGFDGLKAAYRAFAEGG